jgi:ribosomal-protein-alanine N-acetyltransferase
MILQTPRLTLRAMTLDDAERLHGIMSDAEVMAFWDVSEIEDIDLTTAILKSQLANMKARKSVYWAMELSADKTFVGCCDLSEIDRWHHRAEVGFIVAKTYWGDGYAQEAMEAVLDHAAQAMKLRRLAVGAHPSGQHPLGPPARKARLPARGFAARLRGPRWRAARLPAVRPVALTDGGLRPL